jgi:D-glycero-D-manno-heptose 1,7-bisphosphate phosphatase
MSENVFERYQLFIFDADDTLRRTTVPGKPCPHGPGEWELMPGVREILSPIPWCLPGGPFLGLASNQDQIAYGHLSIHMARRLLRDLALAATGSSPPEPALQLCPHAMDHPCDCRKPSPGMLLRIMRFYGVAPAETVFVGNDAIDREAAERAGVAFIWSERLFGQPAASAVDHPQ